MKSSLKLSTLAGMLVAAGAAAIAVAAQKTSISPGASIRNTPSRNANRSPASRNHAAANRRKAARYAAR